MRISKSKLAGSMVAVLLVAALAAACTPPSQPLVEFPETNGPSPVTDSKADVVGPIRLDGNRLMDATGRVVLIHGTNSVRKGEPFISPLEDGWLGPTDLATFQKDGWNGVRLGVVASELMPQPGVTNQKYLDEVEKVVDVLTEKGFWILLDFHQDVFRGMPDWATLEGAAALSNEPPEFLKPIGWSAAYFSPRSMQQWNDWWNNALLPNGRGIVDAYGDGVAAMAERFKDSSNVIGLEMLNEPFPGGDNLLNCILQDCQAQAALISQRFTEITNSVRAVAPEFPVWWEPAILSVLTPYQALNIDGVTEGPNGKQVGLSFHSYCLGTDGGEPVAPSAFELIFCNAVFGTSFDHARDLSRAWNAPSMMTEFGASASPLNVTETTRLADSTFTSWFYWTHPFGPDTWPEEVVRTQLVRTYAQATAGEPLSQSFVPASGEFTFRFRPDVSIDAPTSIVIPAAQYPLGYEVSVEGGTITSAPQAGLLTIANVAGSDMVSVLVTRKIS